MSIADELLAVLRRADATTDALRAERDAYLQQRDDALAKLDAAIAERDEIRAEFDAHLAQPHWPAPVEPEPTPTRTLVGACPNNPGGFSDRALQTVVDRFGTGAHIRGFGGAITRVGPRPAGASGVHLSWDFGDDYRARPTVEQLRAAFTNLQPGDHVERQHESDAKVRRGNATLADAQAALEHFARLAKEARPDLRTIITFTGWLFSPNKTAPGLDARNAWGPTASRFDTLGIDLDGVHTWPLPDYRDHRPNWERFMEQFDLDRLAVPELGTRVNTDRDPDAATRAEWWLDQHGFLAGLGYVEFVDAFVYNMGGNENDMRGHEVDAWSALI